MGCGKRHSEKKKTPRVLRMLFGMCRVRHVQRKKEYRKTKIKITDVFSGLSRLDPAYAGSCF